MDRSSSSPDPTALTAYLRRAARDQQVEAARFSSQQSMVDPLPGGGVRLHIPLTVR